MFPFKTITKKRKRTNHIRQPQFDKDEEEEEEEKEEKEKKEENKTKSETRNEKRNGIVFQPKLKNSRSKWKSKPLLSSLNTNDDDDNDDENDNVDGDSDDDRKRRRKKKKKTKTKKDSKKRTSNTYNNSGGGGGVSFSPDEYEYDENNNKNNEYDDDKEHRSKQTKCHKKHKQSNKTKTKPKKRNNKNGKSFKGLGFGGGGIIDPYDDEQGEEGEEEGWSHRSTSGGYGIDPSRTTTYHDDDDDDDDDHDANHHNHNHDYTMGHNTTNDDGNTTDESTSVPTYSKEAMERLRNEQKFQINDPQQQQQEEGDHYNHNILGGNEQQHSTPDSSIPPKDGDTNGIKPQPPHPPSTSDTTETITGFQPDSMGGYIPLNDDDAQLPSSSVLTSKQRRTILTKDDDNDGIETERIEYDDDVDVSVPLGSGDNGDIGGVERTKTSNQHNSSNGSDAIRTFFEEQASTIVKGPNTTAANNNNNNRNRTIEETTNNDDDVDEGRREWEERIARRANVCRVRTTTTTAETNSGPTTHSTSDPTTQDTATPTSSAKEDDVKTTSVAATNLKSTVQQTLQRLDHTTQTLRIGTLVPRRNEHNLSTIETQRRSDEVSTIGTAFEFYQTLRSDLARWTGACRFLDARVREVEVASEEWRGEVGGRERQKKWREWEDDAVEVLLERSRRRKSRNDTRTKTEGSVVMVRVVGRQPPALERDGGGGSMTSVVAMVDEFGRDATGAHALARGKRRRERIRIRAEARERRASSTTASTITGDDNDDYEHGDCGDARRLLPADIYDSDGDVSDNEAFTREGRRLALSDAARAPLEELEEEYAVSCDLIAVFLRWFDKYPSEYRRCYAGLGLVDLVDVFVRMDVCRELDLNYGCLGDGGDGSGGGGVWSRQDVRKKFSWFGELEKLDQRVAQVDTSDGGGGGEHAKGSNDVDNERTLDLVLRRMCQRLFRLPANEHDTKNDGAKGLGQWDGFDFDPTSKRQCHAVVTFCESLLSSGETTEVVKMTRRELVDAVYDHIKRYVDDMAIPILEREVDSPVSSYESDNEDEEHADAIDLAVVGQLYRLAKIVRNICVIWYPFTTAWELDSEGSKDSSPPPSTTTTRLSERLVRFCLVDVITDRLLPILTSGDAARCASAADAGEGRSRRSRKRLFGRVYDEVAEVGWLDRGDLMLVTAPLRAYAVASRYGKDG